MQAIVPATVTMLMHYILKCHKNCVFLACVPMYLGGAKKPYQTKVIKPKLWVGSPLEIREELCFCN